MRVTMFFITLSSEGCSIAVLIQECCTYTGDIISFSRTQTDEEKRGNNPPVIPEKQAIKTAWDFLNKTLELNGEPLSNLTQGDFELRTRTEDGGSEWRVWIERYLNDTQIILNHVYVSVNSISGNLEFIGIHLGMLQKPINTTEVISESEARNIIALGFNRT